MMLRAFLTIGALQIVTMLVMLVRTKTLALVLGPEHVGAMAVIDKLLAVIVQTVSLSMPFAALRFLPSRWLAGPAEFRKLFVRMRNVLLTLALVAAIGALLVTGWRPSTWGGELLPYRDAVAFGLLSLPALALVPFLQNAVAGRLEQNRSMRIVLFNALALTASTAGILWNGLAGYYALYAVLGTMLVIIFNRRALRGTAGASIAETPRFAFSLPTPVWRFSGALLILTFVAPYAALFVHYKLLRDHGAEAAGWMQAAIGISLSVRAVMGTAHSVFLTPNVNRGGPPVERMQWANRFQLLFCLLAGLAVPPLLLFPDLAVRILYSNAFAPGAPFVVLFVLTEVLTLLSGTYQSLIIALDRLSLHVVTNLMAQALVVVVAWRLVEPLGILGAGLAGLAAPLFLFMATMTYLGIRYRLRMPANVVLRTAWLLAALLASGAAGSQLRMSLWPSLLVKGGLYVVVVAGLAALLTDDERARARAMIAKWRTRWT